MSLPASPHWRLDWSDSLRLGIPEIDAEHRRFIDLINQLNQAIAERMGMEEITRHLRNILEDAEAHFSHEEELLWNRRYPEAADHAEQHQRLTACLHEILQRLAQAITEFELIDTGLKIKNLLIEHLQNDDMRFRDYFLNLAQQTPGS